METTDTQRQQIRFHFKQISIWYRESQIAQADDLDTLDDLIVRCDQAWADTQLSTNSLETITVADIDRTQSTPGGPYILDQTVQRKVGISFTRRRTYYYQTVENLARYLGAW